MTRIAHCCCGSLRAEVTGERRLHLRIRLKTVGYESV